MLPARLALLHVLTLSHRLVHDPYFVGQHALVSIYIWTETLMRDVVILGHTEIVLVSSWQGTAC